MQQERSSISNTCTIKKSLWIFKAEEQDPCETLGLPICQLWGWHRLPAPAEMGANTGGKERGDSLGWRHQVLHTRTCQGPRGPGQTWGGSKAAPLTLLLAVSSYHAIPSLWLFREEKEYVERSISPLMLCHRHNCCLFVYTATVTLQLTNLICGP